MTDEQTANLVHLLRTHTPNPSEDWPTNTAITATLRTLADLIDQAMHPAPSAGDRYRETARTRATTAALPHPCPTCHAPAGQPCRNRRSGPDAGTPMTWPHPTRIADADITTHP